MTKSFLEKIETLLDHEDHFDSFKFEKNNSFQIDSQHEHLERIFFTEGVKQWEILFTRLTAFFEIGFLIQKQEIQRMFFYGDSVEKKLPKLKFKLPLPPLFNILKTRGHLFLNKMGFSLPNADKMNCLLIRVDETQYIVLLTQQADPWLQLRCESLRKALTNHDYYATT